MTSTTESLLGELNASKGLVYPQIGYSFFADVKGDGRNIRSVYTVINEGGGVTYSEFNAATPRERCNKIRAAISAVKEYLASA
jgi:hypothetical protein